MFINIKHQKAYEEMNAGNHQAALHLYNDCILETPDTAILYSERGVNFIHLNQKKNSLADFDKSIELDPGYAYRYASRGHAKDYFGDIDGAIADYEKAIELDPKDDIVYNNLGILLEKKGSIKKSKEYFERSNRLREAEQKLNEAIDQIEGVNSYTPEPQLEKVVSPSAPESEPQTVLQIFSKLFGSPSYRKEFLGFVKNGFKMKKK
ncbi:MAG: tetratricopeptide repeat protein [Bacteroidetes bacterium]|nr:tetratricopeptide repeat protein [Bacteroidota bacterium]